MSSTDHETNHSPNTSLLLEARIPRMFESTRAAKRRKTSSDLATPTSQRTTRRSLPNGHAKSHVDLEQSTADAVDELGVESSPATAVKTSIRNKRSSNLITPKAQSADTSVNKTTKNSASQASKTSTSNRPRKTKPPRYADNTSNGVEAVEALISAQVEQPLLPTTENTVPAAFSPHPSVEILKLVVVEKLVGNRGSSLQGLDDERQKVHTLLHQTVAAGEGNSMLVIGSRGSGKSTMVNGLLEELSRDNHEHFHVIRLNGFIHTDDKLALREIWRQLGREMDVEDESQAKNYADTLAKLLAVLSHPAELSGQADSDRVAKSVIFILDEFDLFASHPRQTLLYNLFDVAQSRKAPIAVLGLTTRVDIAESLEKRVKSRFSHRYVHLGLSKSLATFTQTCRSKLHLESEDLTFDERLRLSKCLDTPMKTPKRLPREGCAEALLELWNDSIDGIFRDSRLTTHLARIYTTTRSIPTALNSFILPVSLLSTPEATAMDLSLLSATLPPDSKLSMLSSLPTLALALLIATARLDIILDTDLCNFNMAYDEYVSLTAKARIAASATASTVSSAAALGGRVWSRESARGMWEMLVQLELLVPAAGGRAGLDAAAVVVADTEMVKCDVALEEIEGSVPDLDKGLVKWCREI